MDPELTTEQVREYAGHASIGLSPAEALAGTIMERLDDDTRAALYDLLDESCI